MPKLWKDTVASHREAVREAILGAVHTQLHAHGLAGVTMSGIAEQAGIGRATLYKYFPDVQAILDAAHEWHVGRHLAELRALAGSDDAVGSRLEAVLTCYLRIQSERRAGDSEVVASLHRPGAVSSADEQLLAVLTTVLTEAADAGAVRTDTAPRDLARFCLQSLRGGDPGHEPADSPLLRLTLAGIAPG